MNVISKVIVGTLLIGSVEARRGGGQSRRGRQGARGAPVELLTSCQDDITDVCQIDVTGFINGDVVDRAGFDIEGTLLSLTKAIWQTRLPSRSRLSNPQHLLLVAPVAPRLV